MISVEMTKDEASTGQNVIERFLDHLQVEIIHTDNGNKHNFKKGR